MKILLTTFTLLLSIVAFSQEYIPMLQEGNAWSVDIYYDPFDPTNPPNPYTITNQVSLGEEVLLNGKIYIQIYIGETATCLLREENGIVYKLSDDTITEKILFDFTLEVDDEFNTFESAYEDYPFCMEVVGIPYENLTVDSVEFLNIAGEIRKVITFSEIGYNNIHFQWIEGIGNISGFSAMWEQVDITNGSLLVCFTNNGNTTFFNEATSCDNTTLSLSENLKEKIILYPNPVTKTSILQFPEENMIDTIKIYDVSGSIVKQKTISKSYYTIDAMQYASGLYFYQVLSKNKIIKTDRFIVK